VLRSLLKHINMHNCINLYDCVSGRHRIKRFERIYSSWRSKSIKKTKEESTPLPDPFPLPTNFCPDVHLCLVKKKMTKASRAAFYTAVAAAMFQYKRYPSRDDFVSVARQIIAKYPFLGSKSFGASHVRSLLVFSMHALPFLMVASHSFPSPTYNHSCRCSMNLKGPHF